MTTMWQAEVWCEDGTPNQQQFNLRCSSPHLVIAFAFIRFLC